MRSDFVLCNQANPKLNNNKTIRGARTRALSRTPAVNTAALPLSSISSSSSSVVAFPAETRWSGAQRQNSSGWTWRMTFTVIYLAGWRAALSLTDLELSLDASFTPLPEVHLSLIVFGHHLHKLPGQHCMLGVKRRAEERLKENAWRRQRFDNDKVAAISWCLQLTSKWCVVKSRIWTWKDDFTATVWFQLQSYRSYMRICIR